MPFQECINTSKIRELEDRIRLLEDRVSELEEKIREHEENTIPRPRWRKSLPDRNQKKVCIDT